MRRAFRADDIRGAEAPLLTAGEPLMERAANAVANSALRQLRAERSSIPGSTALVLVGTGNNGGDGLYAGAYLARRGLQVVAVHGGEPNVEGLAAARSAGVRLHELDGSASSIELLRGLAADAGIWIDALLGIGATGGAREPMATWIRVLTEERELSPMPPFVLAVDLPSGLEADSGAVIEPVLTADLTVTMGAPKPANLLPPACLRGGRLEVAELGLEATLPATPAVSALGDADVLDMWPIPDETDHKYTRGVLGMRTGSAMYPGAGLLGVGAALAVGPGMIRYLGGAPTTAVYPEVVTAPGRVQAWVMGSGMENGREASAAFDEALEDDVPVVLDAGALDLAHRGGLPQTVVLTPHSGELVSLLAALGEEGVKRDDVEADPARWACTAAELTGATLVHKGAIDVIATPTGELYAQGGATPWRGVAGAGDVYAALVGAMLVITGAEGDDVARVAAAASHVHARAANRAAGARGRDGQRRTGHPIGASDIVRALPAVVDEILNGERHE